MNYFARPKGSAVPTESRRVSPLAGRTQTAEKPCAIVCEDAFADVVA